MLNNTKEARARLRISLNKTVPPSRCSLVQASPRCLYDRHTAVFVVIKHLHVRAQPHLSSWLEAGNGAVNATACQDVPSPFHLLAHKDGRCFSLFLGGTGREGG